MPDIKVKQTESLKGLPCPFQKVNGAPVTCQEGYCDNCEIYRKVKEGK